MKDLRRGIRHIILMRRQELLFTTKNVVKSSFCAVLRGRTGNNRALPLLHLIATLADSRVLIGHQLTAGANEKIQLPARLAFSRTLSRS